MGDNLKDNPINSIPLLSNKVLSMQVKKVPIQIKTSIQPLSPIKLNAQKKLSENFSANGLNGGFGLEALNGKVSRNDFKKIKKININLIISNPINKTSPKSIPFIKVTPFRKHVEGHKETTSLEEYEFPQEDSARILLPKINLSKTIFATNPKLGANKAEIVKSPREYEKKYKEMRETGLMRNCVFKLFKEYSYKENQNSKFREQMQDFYKVVEKHLDSPSKTIFSLYDGHGGSETAKYCRDRFPIIFTKLCSERPKYVQENLIKSFSALDEELRKLNKTHEGSTATIVYLTMEENCRTLYVANIGDSRCVLLSSTGASRLSVDHKCIEEEEMDRIYKFGGTVSNGRLFKSINISRSFGDFALKQFGLISKPYINKIKLKHSDKYLVIASDGVWDVLFDNDIWQLSCECKDSLELANEIITKSLELGSTDNLSCIVVKL